MLTSEVSRATEEEIASDSDDGNDIPEMEAPAEGVANTKTQEIINDLEFDVFDYVGPNAYIGKNKIWNYDVENKALRFRAPLGLPRSWQPNHGVVPLLPQLAPQQDMTRVRAWLDKNKKRKQIWKAARSGVMQGKSAIPGDINMQAPSHCLKTWEKPSFMHYTIDTSFKPINTVDGPGYEVDKLGFRSVYDTWASPLKPTPPLPKPGMPIVQDRWQQAQHDHVHY
jgi:hypothetical protein